MLHRHISYKYNITPLNTKLLTPAPLQYAPSLTTYLGCPAAYTGFIEVSMTPSTTNAKPYNFPPWGPSAEIDRASVFSPR